MHVTSAELFSLTLPLVEPFIISGGAVHERRSLIVRLRDVEGHVGYGESPPFETPFYSEETLATAREVIQHLLLPRIVGKSFDGPEQVDAALREGVRGNPFARAGVETAAWDLEANAANSGLRALLGSRLGIEPATAIPCGVALGIPEDRRAETLTRRVAEALEQGYRRVKIKVMPGWDQQAVAAAREAMSGVDLPLTVDANGAYQWPEHETALRALDEARLLYIEQPLAPDELVGHAYLAQRLRTPVCLDETLKSASHARQTLALGGPTVWNIKVHRVGGLTEVLRIYRIAEAHEVELWAGTMPETGIGSQAPLAVAALPACVYPSDLEPSARWYGRNQDVIKLTMDRTGRMAVPDQSAARLLDAARFEATTRLLASLP
jgi:O-succinylbenzoate synthase